MHNEFQHANFGSQITDGHFCALWATELLGMILSESTINDHIDPTLQRFRDVESFALAPKCLQFFLCCHPLDVVKRRGVLICDLNSAL